MLYLQFFIDDESYLVSSKDVVEVIPMVRVKKIPHVPVCIVGAAVYRGISLPIVDICQLLTQRPCKQKLSTRIMVAEVRHDEMVRRIGFLVEKLTGTKSIAGEGLVDSGFANPDTPYLRDMAIDSLGMAQIILLGKVLPNNVYDLLFHHSGMVV
jgi:chemotaxis-related protein WspB